MIGLAFLRNRRRKVSNFADNDDFLGAASGVGALAGIIGPILVMLAWARREGARSCSSTSSMRAISIEIGLGMMEIGRLEGIVYMEFGRARGGAFQLRIVVGFDDKGFGIGFEDNGPGTMAVAAGVTVAVSAAEGVSSV